jgi:hypothetical protein
MRKLLLTALLACGIATAQAGYIENDRDSDKDHKGLKHLDLSKLFKDKKDEKNQKLDNLENLLKGKLGDLFDRLEDKSQKYRKNHRIQWPRGDCNQVPEGGTTALLLGASFVGLGMIRRRQSK